MLLSQYYHRNSSWTRNYGCFMKKYDLFVIRNIVGVILFLLLNVSNAAVVSGQLIIHDTKLAFDELHKGLFIVDGRSSSKTIKVINSEADYKKILATYTRDPAKAVDFEKGNVLLLDVGQRNTGGFSVAVSSVEEHEKYVVVKVAIINPAPGCMLFQAFTNPFQFTYIATHKNLLIVEEMQYHNCQ